MEVSNFSPGIYTDNMSDIISYTAVQFKLCLGPFDIIYIIFFQISSTLLSLPYAVIISNQIHRLLI